MFKADESLKGIVFLILILVVSYIAVFLIWNYTSPNNAPSSLLWDNRKEGYTQNPIGDRYWELRKKEEKSKE